MDEINLSEIFRLWAHEVNLWTGFGTIVGLLARMLMPGKDRAGVLTTVLVGVAGALIGAALLSYFWDGYRLTPLSPIGFGVAIACLVARAIGMGEEQGRHGVRRAGMVSTRYNL